MIVLPNRAVCCKRCASPARHAFALIFRRLPGERFRCGRSSLAGSAGRAAFSARRRRAGGWPRAPRESKRGASTPMLAAPDPAMTNSLDLPGRPQDHRVVVAKTSDKETTEDAAHQAREG